MEKQESHSVVQKSRTYLWTAAVATLASIGVHSYLARLDYDLKLGSFTGESICNINATFNCSAVAASRFAEFLGAPVALWGIAANIALLILLLWWSFSDSESRASIRRNILIVGGSILAASIVMGAISLFAMSQLCIFCLAAYVLSFIMFFCLWKGLGASAAFSSENLRGPASGLTSLAVLAVVGFIGVFVANDQIKTIYGFRDISGFVRDSLQEWSANPPRTFQTVDPLAEGPSRENTKMSIVEFADYRCIHCKHAAPVLRAFMASHPDVRLEFQPWPLDGECNSKIPTSNGASCELARMSWCADKKNKRGWDLNSFIYGQDLLPNKESVEEDLPKIAKAIGMSAEDLKTCVNSEEAKDVIRKQADVGSSLNLAGTPTIFVNGRMLPNGQVLAVLQEAYAQLTK